MACTSLSGDASNDPELDCQPPPNPSECGAGGLQDAVAARPSKIYILLNRPVGPEEVVMETQDLVVRILQHHAPLGTTRVAKLAYLVDLAYVQMTGKALTNLPYLWHRFGPYSDALEGALWSLEEKGDIQVESYVTYQGYDCTLHRPTPSASTAPSPDKTAEAVIEHVVSRFGPLDLRKMLDFVYATPPMVKAKGDGERFVPLDLTAPGSPFGRDELEVVFRQKTTDNGVRIPIDEVRKKLSIG